MVQPIYLVYGECPDGSSDVMFASLDEQDAIDFMNWERRTQDVYGVWIEHEILTERNDRYLA